MTDFHFAMDDLYPEVREDFKVWIKAKYSPDGEKVIDSINTKTIDPLDALHMLYDFAEEKERKENN